MQFALFYGTSFNEKKKKLIKINTTRDTHVVGLLSLETAVLDGMGYIENLFNFIGCN
jgi:hypothetical protein